MRRVVSLAVICPAGAWVRAGAEGKWLSGVRMDSSGRLQLIRPGISYASEDAKLRWRVPARVSKKIIHEFGSGGQCESCVVQTETCLQDCDSDVEHTQLCAVNHYNRNIMGCCLSAS